ncbi:MAG: AMP-binding protein [Castellaniella sp.]
MSATLSEDQPATGITDALYHHARTRPHADFVVFEEEKYTFREMALLVSELARTLHAAGVRPGQRIALMCSNRPAFLVAWFAINTLGAIAVPLNISLKGDSLRYTLEKSQSRLLLVEPALHQVTQRDLQALPDLDIQYIGNAQEQASGLTDLNYPIADTPLSAADPACILFTSGTTGLPKGVVLSHAAYVMAGRDMSASLSLDANARIMVFLPLFHANPQMYAVCSALHTGCTLILIRRFSASRFFEDAIRHRATGFTYVGTVLAILEKQHPETRHDHDLQWCVGGGAPLRIWQAIESRFDIKVRELYGMTETGGWVSMNLENASRPGSVGKAREGVTLAIRDDTGALLPSGQKGEITVSAVEDNLFFTEYWDNPEETGKTLRDGWLYTGDRGWLDRDGYLYFDGRLKELIRRGGEMIAPAEIELQIMKHPGVRDCAVIGVPDDILGEEIKAVLVLRDHIDIHTLKSHLHEHLPGFMLPRYVGFVQEIPKTETQKVKRHEVLTMTMETRDLRDDMITNERKQRNAGARSE